MFRRRCRCSTWSWRWRLYWNNLWCVLILWRLLFLNNPWKCLLINNGSLNYWRCNNMLLLIWLKICNICKSRLLNNSSFWSHIVTKNLLWYTSFMTNILYKIKYFKVLNLLLKFCIFILIWNDVLFCITLVQKLW